jgi:hypothetical protein
MIATFNFGSLSCSVNQIFSYLTEMKMLHKNSFHRNINLKWFYTEEPQVFGVNVQNIFARDLYTPPLLVCLEWFSKGIEIVFLQLKN